VGDESAVVHGVAPLDRATDRDLSFLTGLRHVAALAQSRAAVLLVSPELAESPGGVRARVIVADPQAALVALLPRFSHAPDVRTGIHPTAVIGRGALLGSGVSVGASVGPSIASSRLMCTVECASWMMWRRS
jgi:UDP-3-O-[3-hydroxymyristoyl] glucosamine N-acyltransferase